MSFALPLQSLRLPETPELTVRATLAPSLPLPVNPPLAAPSTDLLPRIASGDSDAVRACIDRYGPPIHALARRALSTEAEDTAQDIFIALWQSSSRFDPALGSELTFVMTLARRKIIDRLRARARRPDFAPLPPDPASSPAPSLSDASELADSAARARAALYQLRPEERNVLELSLLQGFSQSEVAEKISLPLGTVKTHARRGLIRLRQLLGIQPDQDQDPIQTPRITVFPPTASPPSLRLATPTREVLS